MFGHFEVDGSKFYNTQIIFREEASQDHTSEQWWTGNAFTVTVVNKRVSG